MYKEGVFMKVLKVFGKIFAVLFCIIYFFGLTAIMTLMISRNLVSENYYSKVFRDIDLSSIVLSDLGEFSELLEDSGLDETATLEDLAIKFLTNGELFSEEKARAIVQNEEIRSIVGEFVGEFINYAMGGEAPEISKSDLETVLRNPDLNSVTGVPTDEDIDRIYDQLNIAIKDIVEEGGINNEHFERNDESVVVPQW